LGARRAGIAKQSDQSAAPDAVPVRTAAAIHSHAEAPSPAAVQRESLGVERRQLTVMFCDLADSTQLDPEDRRVCSTPYQEQVSEAVRRFDGFIAKYMGDGVLVYFGYPHAQRRRAVSVARWRSSMRCRR
jgi:class 3 adenylate cyclase